MTQPICMSCDGTGTVNGQTCPSCRGSKLAVGIHERIESYVAALYTKVETLDSKLDAMDVKLNKMSSNLDDIMVKLDV